MLPHLADLFQAFFDLSPGRDMTMGGEGYISAREIVAYCDLTGVSSPDERIELFRAIRAMDVVYLTSRRERDEASKAKEPKKSERSQRRSP